MKRFSMEEKLAVQQRLGGVRSVACPDCGADVGEPCRTLPARSIVNPSQHPRRTTKPHHARWAAARAAGAASRR